MGTTESQENTDKKMTNNFKCPLRLITIQEYLDHSDYIPKWNEPWWLAHNPPTNRQMDVFAHCVAPDGQINLHRGSIPLAVRPIVRLSDISEDVTVWDDTLHYLGLEWARIYSDVFIASTPIGKTSYNIYTTEDGMQHRTGMQYKYSAVYKYIADWYKSKCNQ